MPPTPSASPTSSPSTPACGVVGACQADPMCGGCLALAANVTMDPDWQTQGQEQLHFFHRLSELAECSAANSSLLTPAFGIVFASSNCGVADAGNSGSRCFPTEYQCFQDSYCRDCLTELYAQPTETQSVLLTPQCETTRRNTTLLHSLVAGECRRFPACTVVKSLCFRDPDCTRCVNHLSNNEPRAAADRCANGPSAGLIDNLVRTCLATPASCAFWTERCLQDPYCGRCLNATGMGEGIASGYASAACDGVRQSTNARDRWFDIFDLCPATDVSYCTYVVALCVHDNASCAGCMEGTALAHETPLCRAVYKSYGIADVCVPCPLSVFV